MKALDDVVKNYRAEVWLQIALILIAATCYGVTMFNYPLVDYDEATYAKVIVDTFKSGDVTTFTLGDRDWFEKPPLYLWFAMASVKIFGEHEFAFRLPSVLASIVCLWLLYLIVKELTDSPLTAFVTSLVLLFSPPFFVFAREARLDSGVVMAILAALFFCIKGWKNQKFLFWVFPALAIGVLFKSVIAFLAGPILIMYSLFYNQWAWLKSRYLWLGFLTSFVILAPWHILQSVRFGWGFWNDYLIYQVFKRAVSTLTGMNNYYDYVNTLWLNFDPWLIVIFVLVPVLAWVSLSSEFRGRIPWRHIFAPALTALFILIFFTAIRTHLTPYILPAFPFFAMFITLSFYYVSTLFDKGVYTVAISTISSVILLGLVVFGSVKSFTAIDYVVGPPHYEEREVGHIVKKHRSKKNFLSNQPTFYALDWTILETLNYYSDTKVRYLDPVTESGEELKAPFYIVTNTMAMKHFINDKGDLLPNYYGRLQGGYTGAYLILLYSEQDIRLPIFNTRSMW